MQVNMIILKNVINVMYTTNLTTKQSAACTEVTCFSLCKWRASTLSHRQSACFNIDIKRDAKNLGLLYDVALTVADFKPTPNRSQTDRRTSDAKPQ